MSHAEPYQAVTLRAVRKVYGRHVALSGADGKLEAGQITTIVGPNGAGKSTLLRILATLGRPSSGDVHYGDHDLASASELLRHTIGLLAHAPLLYRELSCRENLLFFARLHGVSDIERCVDEALEAVEMTRAAERPVAELSRGMSQRIALARAQLHEPQLILLDEPFSGLDAGAIELLRDALERWREQGRIVVVITHDVASVDGLCDQLWVLSRGHVLAQTHHEKMPADALRDFYREALES
ncbi:MAG: heme ABC exporter ATP-binding protein CcmA [Myxococcales bacterium]|nr:heme ABC exporter ATP-binding protein CcmA [Myxococcales bacterium]